MAAKERCSSHLGHPATLPTALRVFVVPDRWIEHTWLISDPHFDHANVIRYCNRPFGSVDEMNAVIQRAWNSTIAPDDTVIFVGDMCFGRGSRPARWWLRQLTGRKIYVKGSHDHGIRPTSTGLAGVLFVADALLLRAGKQLFYVAHEPDHILASWRGWAVHGHVHGERPLLDVGRKRLNVSVEVTGYKPVNLSDVLRITRG